MQLVEMMFMGHDRTNLSSACKGRMRAHASSWQVLRVGFVLRLATTCVQAAEINYRYKDEVAV